VVRVQDNQGDSSTLEVLLFCDVLVGGQQDIEPGVFSQSQQVAVRRSRPAILAGSDHEVAV